MFFKKLFRRIFFPKISWKQTVCQKNNRKRNLVQSRIFGVGKTSLNICHVFAQQSAKCHTCQPEISHPNTYLYFQICWTQFVHGTHVLIFLNHPLCEKLLMSVSLEMNSTFFHLIKSTEVSITNRFNPGAIPVSTRSTNSTIFKRTLQNTKLKNFDIWQELLRKEFANLCVRKQCSKIPVCCIFEFWNDAKSIWMSHYSGFT